VVGRTRIDHPVGGRWCHHHGVESGGEGGWIPSSSQQGSRCWVGIPGGGSWGRAGVVGGTPREVLSGGPV
jgi:hypothetical protein